MFTRLAVVLSIATGFLVPPVALGQNAAQVPLAPESAHADDRGDYRELVARGIAEFNLGHWPEARAFFLRAHAIRPNARTLRTLGLVSYELRDYVAALQYLRQALASTERPLTDEMRADAQTALEEAQSFVTHLVVVLEPRDASLRVNGRAVALPADGSLVLNPGVHEFSAELMGFAPATRTVDARGGDQIEIRLRLLQPTHASDTTTHGGPSEGGTDASWVDSLSAGQYVGLAVAAVGVLGLGAGTTFSVLAVNENQASKEGCDEVRCTSEGAQYRRNAQARADAATVSFIAAGALLGTGAALLFFAGTPEREPAAWTPIVSPTVAGLAYRGAL